MPLDPGRLTDLSEKFKNMNRGVDISGISGGFRKLFTKRYIIIAVILLLVVVFFAVIVPFANFYTDALWYNHEGYQNLFWKMFWAKIIMVVVFWALFFIVLYGNVLLARRIPPEQKLDAAGSPLEPVVEKVRGVWARIVRVGLIVFAVVAAFTGGLAWGGRWEIVLKFLNHSAFGKADPVFNKDIGFYVFSYPFQRALVDWLLSVFIFTLIVVVVVYLLDGGIRMKRGPEMFAPNVKAHLSVLAGLIFIIKAWSYRLNMFELLFSKRGVVYGAGYTDVNARIPALWILMILSLVIAAALIANIWFRGWKLPATAIGLWLVVTLLAGSLYPLLVQQLGVKPNERTREAEYLARNIRFTRDAYKINDVKSKPYDATDTLDLAGIERNRATVRNIRLWDPNPLLSSFEQLQSIRQYYTFYDVDVDRYVVDGEYRQTMIGAREMVQENLPQSAKTWVNKTLVYTHGYGVALTPSNDVTQEGNPNFFIKDIPPRGPTDMKVRRPEIYFGERSGGYIVVKSTEKEFDYPLGDRKIYTTYRGNGGTRVNSFWRKILYSIRFRDINLIFSGQVKDDSRVMFYRDVRERVKKCAPFLDFDNDPYIVISDSGKLFWIVDGYSTTSKYPYSQPTEGLGNYVRNSVKAVVDAYEGRVWLYVVDPDDPVIKTYRRIFPQIFTSFDRMPPDLKRHIRYPEDYFTAQANILRTYHMTDPKQFYTKEDEWVFPQEIRNGKQYMVPYYVIMKLPGERGEEMVLIQPFTPNNKKNMISWLAARMDGDSYGELINFVFPSGRLVFGPEQVEGRIEQDPEISRQLSLWRTGGSRVIRGDLLVIPIEQALLYVEPLYLQAVEIQIPQIKRVVVVYGEQVVMEPTLEGAIARVFAGAPATRVEKPPTETKPSKTAAGLAAEAADLYKKAVEAQKAGDWSAYGNYLDRLSDVLKQLEQATR